MSLADSIISAMEDSKTSEFEKLRSKLKTKKPLSKQDFRALVKLLEIKAIEILATNELSMNECRMIGKAILASKLRNIDEIIKFVINREDNKTPLLLHNLLNKNCKIDLQPLREYLNRMVCGEMHLCHYKVLLVVSKNYPSLMSAEILDFCEADSHPVSKELVKTHRIEIV